jgi:dTDP-4-amino-4,6-dideoxygalactose transaminase
MGMKRDRSRSRSRDNQSGTSPTRASEDEFEKHPSRSKEVPAIPKFKKPEEISFGPDGYDFTSPGPVPEAAQERVQELLKSGRLFRYQGGVGDVAELEKNFSEYIGVPYTMACNSGGCGLFLALKALGVKPGDKVLLNAWTLSPVPGAIVHASATPVFVKSDHDTLTIDLDDLEKKVEETGAKILLLSYMRGQIPNMDRLMEIVTRMGITLLEDCAHTLGAKWKLDGEEQFKHIGTFGAAGVWSLQTNKSINCGEGGLISTSRQDIAARVTVASGSYGHWAMNGASGDSARIKDIYSDVPNMSMRLTTMAAAIAKPQLELLPDKLKAWARHAYVLRKILKACLHTRTIKQLSCVRGKEICVWSSIQFELIGFTEDMVQQVIDKLAAVGVPLAWFGGPCKGFTSTLKDWKFADPSGEKWKDTIANVVKSLVDLPLYHTAYWEDCVIEKLGMLIVGIVTCVAGMHEVHQSDKEVLQSELL